MDAALRSCIDAAAPAVPLQQLNTVLRACRAVPQEYKPSKLTFGKPHPDAVVETASLAAVEPPDITYQLKVGWRGEWGLGGWRRGCCGVPQGGSGGVKGRWHHSAAYCCSFGCWHTPLTPGLTLLALLPQAHDELVASLSALQLESVVYACQRHEQLLPDGSRGGFFIGARPAAPCCTLPARCAAASPATAAGRVPALLLPTPLSCGTRAPALPAGDGAGVGKGRTIAGLILENWRQGRHKHLWLSVGSDLKIDSQRDLNDVGGGCRVWQGGWMVSWVGGWAGGR